jgi:CheY-like chemotaxis protein/anti-sigma regulatory factor (Ser/Thr protein kinase)
MIKLLVVDDNPLDRELAAGFLEGHGYQMEYAENGAEGLTKVRDTKPDLVLTDLDMPELNGLQLVRALHAEFPLLPVILMTAKGSEDIAVQALGSGASSYVPKRALGTGLAETVRIVLDAARSRRLRHNVFSYMMQTESEFSVGHEHGSVTAMVEYFHDSLEMMKLVQTDKLTRICTALTEAIMNAIDHGNLELDSKLLEGDDPNEYRVLRTRRLEEEPYSKRKIRIHARLSREDAVFTIEDEGPGFDITKVPDPTDPENLMRPCGRGLLLIRTFIPDVTYNDKGNQITLRIKKK